MPLLTLFLLLTPFKADAECPFTLDRSLEQGIAVFGALRDGYSLSLDNKNIPINDDGRFIIGLGRDYGKKALFTVFNLKNKDKSICPVKVKKGNWNIERVNGVEPAKVTPPESFLKRIAKEGKIIKEARNNLTTTHFPYRFIAPVKGRISGVFGSQRIFNGKKRSPHSGNDIAAPNGTPVAAVEDGRVAVAYPDSYYNGNVVVIDHGFYVNTTYAHLSEINVKTGDIIKKGDIIGKVGSTGRSTGNHLHITLNVLGTNVKPNSIIPIGGNIQSREEYEKEHSNLKAATEKEITEKDNKSAESKVYRLYKKFIQNRKSEKQNKPQNDQSNGKQ